MRISFEPHHRRPYADRPRRRSHGFGRFRGRRKPTPSEHADLTNRNAFRTIGGTFNPETGQSKCLLAYLAL